MDKSLIIGIALFATPFIMIALLIRSIVVLYSQFNRNPRGMTVEYMCKKYQVRGEIKDFESGDSYLNLAGFPRMVKKSECKPVK